MERFLAKAMDKYVLLDLFFPGTIPCLFQTNVLDEPLVYIILYCTSKNKKHPRRFPLQHP